jgi:hypothetical protein
MSIREIARRFHHSRRKIRQILAEAEPRPYTRTQERPAPVLGVTDQKSSADLERLVSARRSAVDPGVSFQECAKQNPSCSLSCSPGMP